MSELRKAKPLEPPRVFSCLKPHSNFQFVENEFGPLPSLSRILSQCRKSEFKTIVFEKIENIGFSKSDDDELNSENSGLISSELFRLSFFTTEIKNIQNVRSVENPSFIGYAIIKKIVFNVGSPGFLILENNKIPNGSYCYVFESIIHSPRHDNNYVHMQRKYEVLINDKTFEVTGNLYCQQNVLTHVCAHVALRTALSALLLEGDISYFEMNSILRQHNIPHSLGEALGDKQIRTIIEEKGFSIFQLPFNNPNYPQPQFPYHKFIYAGIESGWPVLLGIQFPQGAGHIIPILGHTFNEDTWAPYADIDYFFQVGTNTRYISSETWVSTFIGHDDNFGSNFCIPRNYLERRSLLVVIIAPKECEYDAIEAEAIAIDYLYSIAPNLINVNSNFWLKKILASVVNFKIVLRAVLIKRDDYINHLKEAEGWEGGKIPEKLIAGIDDFLKQVGDLYWMVEISHPELFPANHRKLGEILLNASIKPQTTRDFKNFVLARLPENFYFLSSMNQPTGPIFFNFASFIKDHVDIYFKTQNNFKKIKPNIFKKIYTISKNLLKF